MGQAEHTTLPEALQNPRPQHTPARAELPVPTAQAAGTDVPGAGQAKPAGQGSHAVADEAPAVLL